MTFIPKGVCSRGIHVDVQDGVINEVSFLGGCDGNLRAISKIVKGRKADEIVEIFSGTPCGRRGTSCTDQLAIALKQALGESEQKV